MGYDGYGNFTRDFNWEEDAANSILITASRMDAEFDNFAAGMNQVMLRSGVAPMTGALKLGGNKITGLAGGSAASPAIQANTDVTTGFWFPTPAVMGITVAGTERARFANTGFSVTGKLGVNTATPRADLDISGLTAMRGALEETVIAAAALTGAVQLDFKVASIYVNTANAVGNFTFNLRGDATTTLDSLMAIGQTVSFSIEVPCGATAYYCTAITVDGAVPSNTRWLGAAPTAGSVSAVNTYLIRATKTGVGTFLVRASVGAER